MKTTRKARYVIPVSFLISASSLFAQSTFTGVGTSLAPAAWSAATWTSTAPTNSATTGTLTFNSAANNFSNNDLTNLTVGGISVLSTSKDNTITGNTFNLSGDVSVATASFQNINTGINLNGTRAFTVSSGQLTLGGALADGTSSGGITKFGGSALVLSGNNTYTGTTTIEASDSISLIVNNNNALGSTSAGTTVKGVTAGGGSGTTISLKNGITVTGETLTLSTATGTRASLFAKDTNGVSAWNGNVSITGAGQAAFWAENSAKLTVGASATDTIIGDGTTILSLRGATAAGTGIINSSIDLNGGNLTMNMPSPGSWTLKGNNTDIGIYTVTGGGTLQFATTQSLHSSDTTKWTTAKISVQGNSTLAFNVGGTGEFSTTNVTTLLTNLGASTATTGFSAGSKIGFDTTNATGGTFTVANTIANSTAGALGLTKLGTNTLVLTASNSYTGSTTISGGTLQLGNGGTTGSLSTSSAITNNATLAINRFNTVTQGTDFASTVSGTGKLVKSGAGNLILSGANTLGATDALTFSGTSGTVTLTNVAALGVAGNTVRFSGGGSGVLDLQTDTSVNAYNVSSGSFNGGTINVNRATTGAGITHALGILDLSSVTLTANTGGKVNSGTARISFTELRMNGGNDTNSVKLAGSATYAIGSASIASTGIAKRLQLDGTSDANTIGLISNTNNGTLPAPGNPNGAVVNVIKDNNSTWTMTAANTYSGTTTINAGTLAMGVNNTFANASNFTMAGGTLAVGSFSDTVGTLNLLLGNSTITLGSGGTFAFADSSALDSTWAGSLSITGSFVEGSSIRFGTTLGGLTNSQLARITFNGNAAALNSTGFLVSAIPEPSTYAAFAGLGVLILAAYRRRPAKRA